MTATQHTHLQNVPIAIDFDGTCVTHEYPEIGKEIGAPPVLRDLAAGGAKLILWTMRSGDKLQAAVDWFKRHEIPLYAVNNNPDQDSWTDSRKVFARLYIDDAALGAPLIPTAQPGRPHIDWNVVRASLLPTPPPAND